MPRKEVKKAPQTEKVDDVEVTKPAKRGRKAAPKNTADEPEQEAKVEAVTNGNSKHDEEAPVVEEEEEVAEEPPKRRGRQKAAPKTQEEPEEEQITNNKKAAPKRKKADKSAKPDPEDDTAAKVSKKEEPVSDGAEDNKEDAKAAAEEDATEAETSKPDEPKGRGRKRANPPKAQPVSKPKARKRGANHILACPGEDKPEKEEEEAEPVEAEEKAEDADTESSVTNTKNLSEEGNKWNVKITSWNISSLKTLVKKDASMKYIKEEDPDILCVQETKITEDKIPSEARFEGYESFWAPGEKGYAGVGIYSKVKPLSVKIGIDNEDFDSEGRCVTLEFEKYYLVGAYVPNAGQGLKTLPKRLKWNEAFDKFLTELDKKKPVVLCGDLNVAHEKIDLANPDTNTKSAGFTQEERDGFTHLLELGFVDSFRHLYPKQEKAYTFWSMRSGARARNVGWRLDYFVISKRLIPNLCDNMIRSDVPGSDHCPITLFLSI